MKTSNIDIANELQSSWTGVSWLYGTLLPGFSHYIVDLTTSKIDDIIRDKHSTKLNNCNIKFVESCISGTKTLGSKKESIECRQEFYKNCEILVEEKIILRKDERKVIEYCIKVFKKIYSKELELIANGVEYND